MGSLEAICQTGSGSIIEASLEIARDAYPKLDLAETIDDIDHLCVRFRDRIQGELSSREVIDKLNNYFFGELGFTGNVDNYYDPRNSYLNEVVKRRRGIPITLSILYQAIAREAGLSLQGINFPSHFLLVHRGSPTTYIDVFHMGRRLHWRDLQNTFREVLASAGITCESDLPDITQRDTLLRMLRNLKGIYTRREFESCLRVQERIVQLQPESPAEWRDLGVLLLLTGRPIRASEVLKQLLQDFPDFPDRRSVERYLQQAREELVQMN